ncbi:Holliday junction resolvase, partial [Streptomyces rimosus subsp. pseudoverticillatus]
RVVLIERGIDEWVEDQRPECVVDQLGLSQHNVPTLMVAVPAEVMARVGA